jgi:C4-dicarboxylate-specific signal transduction histidine kinase
MLRNARLLILLCLLPQLGWADTIYLGALAYRGPHEALARWSATAEYLSRHIPEHDFQVKPLGLESLRKAVAADQVHFVLTNPGHYVALEALHGATRIATLQARYAGDVYTRFGAVIITRADRDDLTWLGDLKGRSLMAVAKEAFGGFQMGWRELAAAGIDPFADVGKLLFVGFPQDAIVQAVLDGKADAGIVRSGILERLISEGRLMPDRLKVLNRQKRPDFMPALSTRLYPEWPFAKVKHTPEVLAKQVAKALLAMPATDQAARAARAAGWTIPLDYTPVHELMRELRIGPYRDLGQVTWRDVLREYAVVLVLAAMLFLVLVAATLWVGRTNRQLAHSQAQLARNRDTLEQEVGRRTRELRRVNMALERDIDARRRAEASLQRSGMALQLLYAISVDPVLGHEEKLKRLLRLGRKHFDMEAALLHRVDDQGLVLCASDGDSSHAEAVAGCLPRFDNDIGPIEVHPPPGSQCERTLLGFPVLVGGERRCVLAFVGELRERPPLEPVDRELLRLMAQWIGAEMARQNAEDERDRHRAQLAKVARLTTMGEMASGLAHEINQPLTAAANYTGGSLRRLREAKPDIAAVQVGMEKALQGITRATEIIRHLRSFMTTGVPEQERFDLNTSVRRVLDLVAPEARRAEVVLDDALLGEGPLWLLGDSIQVEQVVMNLVRNAVEASSQDGRVVVGSGRDENMARLWVQDQGAGFDAGAAEHLFDPFYSTKADGMGLGLAISRSIIEAHGGRLWAEQNNPGASFIFTLPLPAEGR